MNEIDFSKGLVPAIIQDVATGSVLMLAYMNEEAYRLSEKTGWAHFWSRSREELWKKGETSGNTLAIESMSLDCDADAILVRVHPAGPTCHTGSTTCFGEHARASLSVLGELDALIASRSSERPAGSYTTSLLDGGPSATGRKLVEEATELLLAVRDHADGSGNDRRVAEEAADLLYHTMVTLAERGLSLRDAADVLAERRT